MFVHIVSEGAKSIVFLSYQIKLLGSIMSNRIKILVC